MPKNKAAIMKSILLFIVLNVGFLFFVLSKIQQLKITFEKIVHFIAIFLKSVMISNDYHPICAFYLQTKMLYVESFCRKIASSMM